MKIYIHAMPKYGGNTAHSYNNIARAVFSAMKTEYVVVAEQAHPLGPAYSINVGRGYAWYYCCMP